MKRMMNYREMLKRVLPMFALAGAGLMIGCNKPVDDPYAEPIDPVKVLPFGEYFGFDSIQYDVVMKYANAPHIIKIIYFSDSIHNNNNYDGFTSTGIRNFRNYLQERLDYTPKATGGGTIIFRSMEASVEDSLWFVQNGWKIQSRHL